MRFFCVSKIAPRPEEANIHTEVTDAPYQRS